MLAADFVIPSTWAASLLLSSSKCRSTRISRSKGSIALSISWSLIWISARAAFSLIEVIRPIRFAARETVVACGIAPR